MEQPGVHAIPAVNQVFDGHVTVSGWPHVVVDGPDNLDVFRPHGLDFGLRVSILAGASLKPVDVLLHGYLPLGAPPPSDRLYRSSSVILNNWREGTCWTTTPSGFIQPGAAWLPACFRRSMI